MSTPITGIGGGGGGPGTDTTAVHDDTAGEISAVTEKYPLVGEDLILIEDSEAGNAKKMADIDSILSLVNPNDPDAFHVDGLSEIGNLTPKAAPLANVDMFLIEDSAASYAKKSVTVEVVGNSLPTNLVGTLAALLAMSPRVGQVGLASDSSYYLVCRVAGTWIYRHPLIHVDLTLPPSASWNAFNSGSVSASGGQRVLTVPAGATVSWKGEYRTQPAGDFWVKAWFDMPFFGTGGGIPVALGGTDATGIAAVGFTAYSGGLARPAAAAWRLSNATTYVSADAEAGCSTSRVVGLYYEDNGTAGVRRFGIMDPNDGTVIRVGGDYGRTVTITGTSIGWWASAEDADLGLRPRLLSWQTGTP